MNGNPFSGFSTIDFLLKEELGTKQRFELLPAHLFFRKRG